MAESTQIILVPVDGSESAQEAARFAGELASRLEVSVRLLYVFPERPLDLISVPYEAASAETLRALEMSVQNFEKMSEETSAKAFEAAKGAIQHPVQVEQQILRGEPGPAIVTAAAKVPGALVVIGRRRRSRLGEMFLLGSVSRYVTHHAPCPVLIAR